MDDLDNINPGKKDNEEPIHLDGESETIPFDNGDDDTTSPRISHSPLQTALKKRLNGLKE